MTIGHSLAKLSIGILCATCAWSQQYTISTIAGTNVQGFSGDTGDPTKAQLNDPVAVAVDSSGNVYIADANNGVIRMVSGSTISTIVGGSATPFTQLNHPDGLALGPGGVIYIADTGNKRIA